MCCTGLGTLRGLPATETPRACWWLASAASSAAGWVWWRSLSSISPGEIMPGPVVIEAPDGSLAGCCTVWLDATTGWAELEPLGIVPEHRNRGLSKALALDVCRRVGELDGHSVFINCAPLPYYRAPWDAYLKAGFTPMDRGIRMSRAESADAA